MARVNICGFETGDLSECSGFAGTFETIQAVTVRSGQYALKIATDGVSPSWAQIQSLATDGTPGATSVATSYLRFYFLFVTLPASASEEIFNCLDTASAQKLAIRINSSGNLSVWSTTTQYGSTGATVLAAGVWYCIEIKISTGNPSAWELRIDGVSEISGSNNLSTLNAEFWVFGQNTVRNSKAVEVYYDDIAIDDAAYPGPGSIVRLDPSADVAKTNWLNQAGSSTNEFQSVDDLASQVGHDTDTTYVVTSSSGTQTFTVSFPALSTRQIIGTINEIKLIAWGRDTGTANTWQIQVKPTSNAATTTALDGGNTYAMRAILYKTSGGTDALTKANVNTCQASIIKTQSQARELRCTAMALMLDLPGVSGPSRNIGQAMNRAASW